MDVFQNMFRWAGESDSVKRHLRGRHLSVLNLKFDFISDDGGTREEQIALSLKRHLFPHGGREPKAFWISFSRVHPPSEIKSNFKFKTLKRHLLKRHLTLSEWNLRCVNKHLVKVCQRSWFLSPETLLEVPAVSCNVPLEKCIFYSQRAVHGGVNMGGHSNTIRRSNLLFSIVVVFLVRWGPLGGDKEITYETFNTRRIILGNSICFLCAQEKF